MGIVIDHHILPRLNTVFADTMSISGLLQTSSPYSIWVKKINGSPYPFTGGIEMTGISGGTGYVATQSNATYVLDVDALIVPTVANTVAILLDSLDNVVVDLQGHNLSCQGATPGSIGIKVVNCTNVILRNGEIGGFRESAVVVTGSVGVVTDNLTYGANGVIGSFGGMVVLETTDFIAQGLNSQGNTGGMLYATGTKHITVTGCNSEGCIGGAPATANAYFPTLSGALCTDIFIASSATTQSSDIVIEGCKLLSAITQSGDCVGIEIGAAAATARVQNVVIRGNTVAGRTINGSTLNTYITNDASAYAIVSTDNFVIEHCAASGCAHPAAAAPGSALALQGATGFSINDSTNGVIRECSSVGHSSAAGIVSGFRVRGCDSVDVLDCSSSGNAHTAGGEAWSYQTDVQDLPTFGISDTSTNCKVLRCTFGKSSSSSTCGGIKVFALAFCDIEHNTISGPNGAGVYIVDPKGVKTAFATTIANNECFGCSGGGFVNTLLLAQAYSYYGNVAKYNGVTPTYNVNYSAMPAGVSVLAWANGVAPPAAGLLDNVSITA